jgi:predicted dehydrogenase
MLLPECYLGAASPIRFSEETPLSPHGSTFRVLKRPKEGDVRKIRYAVVGLGHISQAAFLPGVKNTKNSVLAALVSDDDKKRRELAKKYRLPLESTYSYEQYEQCLQSGNIDAVYIGLPNHMHCEYTARAARAGVHVLCEKPMAVNEKECEKMIAACEESGTKLMIAYRLHFDPANLEAVKIANSGKLGDLRIFSSIFSQQIAEENVRATEPESRGGGSLYDMGVYCINAARYLFRDEPTEVFATAAGKHEERFRETAEMTTVIMRFPRERIAVFTSSFGATKTSEYSLVGTEGRLRLSPAYDYSVPLAYELEIGESKPERKKFARHDQFGAEIEYFSDCILKNRDPEPSGLEGLADIRVVRAILDSAAKHRPVQLPAFERHDRPSKRQEFKKPAVEKPEVVHASSPSGH